MPAQGQSVPQLLEPLQFMWIRRAGLGLHGKARAAVVGLHLKDGIDARIRPASGDEVFYRQAGLPQPSCSIHKHRWIISTVMITSKCLLPASPGLSRTTSPDLSSGLMAGAER